MYKMMYKMMYILFECHSNLLKNNNLLLHSSPSIRTIKYF
ncbi:hypothetical protein IWQ55_006407 [Labrenzia sp. EL_208]|nr:hypothetical protein [Labrenzia sp. EL_132]MBG6233172.1 hypothetical protein [Labrenzia sp. EL_208]